MTSFTHSITVLWLYFFRLTFKFIFSGKQYATFINVNTNKAWRTINDDGEINCDGNGTDPECLFYLELASNSKDTYSIGDNSEKSSKSSAKKTKSKGKLVLDSSSDDESDDEFAKQLLSSKRMVDDDEDEDEDEDEDDEEMIKAAPKRKKMILSDDDDDDE